MAIPLRKKSLIDEEPYQRRVKNEQLIDLLENLSAEELIQRCIDNEDPIPSEVMLYFLRNVTKLLDYQTFKVLFTALFSRLEATLKRTIPDWVFGNAHQIREEILERFAELIAEDRNGEHLKLDYYEVNFNSAFATLRKDVLRKIGPANQTDPLEKAISLTGMENDSVEILPDVENRIIQDFELGQSKLDDPSFRFSLHEAINKLPNDEREALGLLLIGMPIEAKDPNACSISNTLQCSIKTVSNRLNRAYARLRHMLVEEEEV